MLPPDENSNETPERSKPHHARRKYIRAAGEKPNLSTKMAYLLDQLLTASKRNPNSIHFDPFAAPSEEVEELDANGKTFPVKTVVL